MNRYGQLAMQHWKQHLPRRFGALQDADAYFRELGDQVLARIDELEAQEPVQRGNDYLANLGKLTNIRMVAEELALKELALLEPEDGE